jgi:ferrous iron transport protein B
LARAATLIDRPFSKLGLSGRSFVPLLSGFACAVPAMMATRNINSSRERWIVLFILPLMTCSARLPVYALLLSFLFFGSRAWQAGIALAILYILSIVIGAVAASLVNRILKHQRRGHFVMELPVYRQPQWFLIFKTSLYKTKSYAQRAGPVIFAVALTLWLLSSFPRENGQAPPLAHSYTAQIGKKMEPIFKPMGLDWRAGVGLLSAFSAREVFVSSLALVMNLSGHAKDKQLREGLLDKMRNAVFENGQRVFTQASVAGLICFFMLASQCLSTTTMAAREWRSWRLAIFQVVFFNGLAYALSICVVQTLRAFGIP